MIIRGLCVDPYYLLYSLFFFNSNLAAMDKKPYHHIYKDGKLFAFRNLEGGPKRDPNFKWNWKLFREEKRNLKLIILLSISLIDK